MGIISKIFNFDNIGGKIKGLAKWSCWITILLIWIAAPISFIDLVSGFRTAELCWIPLVGAIVGPILVWVGSWAMYAFGEFVERTCKNEEKTTLILEKLTEEDVESNCATAEEVDEDYIEENYIEDDEPQEVVPACTKEERKRKITRINDLRKKGLISEELYQKAKNNPRVLDKF